MQKTQGTISNLGSEVGGDQLTETVWDKDQMLDVLDKPFKYTILDVKIEINRKSQVEK